MSSLAAVVVAASVVVGQANEPGVPTKILKELEYVVGDWSYEGKEDGKVVYSGTWSVRWAPGKHCVIGSWSGKGLEGMVQGTGVMGWDVAKKQIVQFSLSSLGEHAMDRYTVTSSTQWEGESTGVNNKGKPITSKLRLEKKANEFTWTLTARTEGGESQADRVFRFRRK